MKRPVLSILLFFAISVLLYFAISYFLLDGHVVYWTSSHRFSLEDSKTDDYFITDQLNVSTQGDSLNYWNTLFNIWTNKREETKFVGFALHWTFCDSTWRYRNLEAKTDYVRNQWFRSKLIVNRDTFDYMKNFSGGWQNCCNDIGCKVNDTVTIQFTHAIKGDTTLGSITTIAK